MLAYHIMMIDTIAIQAIRANQYPNQYQEFDAEPISTIACQADNHANDGRYEVIDRMFS